MTVVEPAPVRRTLQAEFGDRVLTGVADREQRGHDESHHRWEAPGNVVLCTSTRDVARALEICSAAGCPVVPFGTGTGLEGGSNAEAGWTALDLSPMNRVLRVSPGDLDVTVQAGVTRLALDARLRDEGLFFPVDPGADASLGGMAATRASGTNAVRYGTMRDNVLGLTVVLADGTVVRTGGRARKSAAGYDLTGMFVGSEGTLGVITELTLRVHGVPETVSAAVCAFPDLASATRAVQEVLANAVPLARIELLDEVMIGAVNAYSRTDLPVAPTLFLEFHGSPAAVAEQVQEVRGISADHGCLRFEAAASETDRRRLWKARHDALPAARALVAGAHTWSTDVCVPISALADNVAAVQADVAAAGILAPIAGHVGDGNFHLAFVLRPGDDEALGTARAINDRMVRRALAAGGTCTGEHGIGLGKRASLAQEHPTGVPVMRALKHALDPAGILNPGKVLG